MSSTNWNSAAKPVSKPSCCKALPSGNAYPSEADDRFWARALELNMPVSVHVDLDRTGERKGPLFKYPKEIGRDHEKTDP